MAPKPRLSCSPLRLWRRPTQVYGGRRLEHAFVPPPPGAAQGRAMTERRRLSREVGSLRAPVPCRVRVPPRAARQRMPGAPSVFPPADERSPWVIAIRVARRHCCAHSWPFAILASTVDDVAAARDRSQPRCGGGADRGAVGRRARALERDGHHGGTVARRCCWGMRRISCSRRASWAISRACATS